MHKFLIHKFARNTVSYFATERSVSSFQSVRESLASCREAVEVSRICSSLANAGIEAPMEFWDEVVEKLIDSSSFPSAGLVHVLDRVAANGVVPARLDELIASIDWTRTDSLSGVDLFLAQRALLLLGYPLPAVRAQSVQICSLMGTEYNDLIDVNSLSTPDLIAAALVTSRSNLKSCGTELIRRIELFAVSPHACVDLIWVFSKTDHPKFMQAAFAYLLSNENYKVLSRSELATVLHATSIAEMENTVLTREIVVELAKAANIDSKILEGLSESKTFVPKAFVHALTKSISNEVSLSIQIPGLLNLLMNGVCVTEIDRVVKKCMRCIKQLDLIDLASLALLAAASSGLKCPQPTVASWSRNPTIPPEALEITFKSNPALPRSDVKKKRLAKRSVERAELMFNNLVWPDLNETPCCSGIANRDMSVIYRACIAKLSTADNEAVRDILESIFFLDLRSMKPSQLRLIEKLIDKIYSTHNLEGNHKLPMEERRSDEASVAKLLRANLAMPNTVGTLTHSSRTRIGIVISH